MKRNVSRLPIAIAAMGAAACILRFALYRMGTDEKGLLIPGHPLSIGLWLLFATAVVLVTGAVWRETGSRPYAENFPKASAAWLGCLAFAAGFGVTTALELSAFTLLERLQGISGLLAAPALIAIAVCRKLGKRPFFALHLLVCVALTLFTVNHYRTWSSFPQLQDSFFPMMGCLLLMLFAYYQTAFDVDIGSRRMQLGTGLLAAFCCFAAIAGTGAWGLYLTGGIWTLTNLCTLTPAMKQKEEKQ